MQPLGDKMVTKAAISQLVFCPDATRRSAAEKILTFRSSSLCLSVSLISVNWNWSTLWACFSLSSSCEDTGYSSSTTPQSFCCKKKASCSPWFYPHILVVTQTAAPPAPSVSPSVCPPGTSGCSSHCLAVRWTPWPSDTSPLPQLVSPYITNINMKKDDVMGLGPFYWEIKLVF